MKVTAVESSTLVTVAYDEVHKLLQLEFRCHALYRYFRVPATVHEALLSAPSKGSYFSQEIRGKFPYSRVYDSQANASAQTIPVGSRR
jgi:KTSC domain